MYVWMCESYDKLVLLCYIPKEIIRFVGIIISLSHSEIRRITIISNLPFLTHILLEILYKKKRETCHRNIKCRIELDNHRILNSTWVKKYNLCFSYKQMVIRVWNCYTGITLCQKIVSDQLLLIITHYVNNEHLTCIVTYVNAMLPDPNHSSSYLETYWCPLFRQFISCL